MPRTSKDRKTKYRRTLDLSDASKVLSRATVLNEFSESEKAALIDIFGNECDLPEILIKIDTAFISYQPHRSLDPSLSPSKIRQKLLQAKKTLPKKALWLQRATSEKGSLSDQVALEIIRKSYDKIVIGGGKHISADKTGWHKTNFVFRNFDHNASLIEEIIDFAVKTYCEGKPYKKEMNDRQWGFLLEMGNIFYIKTGRIPHIKKTGNNQYGGDFLSFLQIVYGHYDIKITSAGLQQKMRKIQKSSVVGKYATTAIWT